MKNTELIEKAKQTKSLEELIAAAKQAGIELTDEKAKEVFEKTHPKTGALSDDELDDVAGGCDTEESINTVFKWECEICGVPFSTLGNGGKRFITIDGGGERSVCINCCSRFGEKAVAAADISHLQRICHNIVIG